MDKKVLVPLDGSKEAEEVVSRIRPELTEDSEVILLTVIHPQQGQRAGQVMISASEREEAERTKAMDYLRGVTRQLDSPPGQWRTEVVLSRSVPGGIADFAMRENVDLIAMYTHDRKGLARLIRGSVAEKVRQAAATEVRVFTPRELAASRL